MSPSGRSIMNLPWVQQKSAVLPWRRTALFCGLTAWNTGWMCCSHCHGTTTVYNRFRDALWHCGIAHKGRGYGPRVHDLRHTFAVRSMQKLKKSKSDIVTTLPYLSAYLGHCNMSATQIYLHLTAECYRGVSLFVFYFHK